MLRRINILALAFALTAGGGLCTYAPAQSGRQEQKAEQPAQANAPVVKPGDKAQVMAGKDGKTPTAEQLAEFVILVYGGGGGRSTLAQIRRNGVERGKTTRATEDGRSEEITYEQRFVRGESFAKDKMRLEQKTPSMEYALVYNEGRVWGVINGAAFTPRQETADDFLLRTRHGIDALLRYKENGSTLSLVGKEKQKGLDLWVLDLTDKEGHKTRYFISANPDIRRSGRVLWLEYERPAPAGGEPIKFKRTYHDYRYAQNTLVPYRTVLYQGDRQVQETRVLTVTYGIRMDDAAFQNPEAAANPAQP